MANQLVVVESPAKARTIKKYLGSGFEVMASYGHVRDLVPREGAVEPGRDFEMHYEPIEKAPEAPERDGSRHEEGGCALSGDGSGSGR